MFKDLYTEDSSVFFKHIILQNIKLTHFHRLFRACDVVNQTDLPTIDKQKEKIHDFYMKLLICEKMDFPNNFSIENL